MRPEERCQPFGATVGGRGPASVQTSGLPYSPPVRTWIKVTLGAGIVAAVAFIAIAGTGTYYFLRHLDTGSSTEADSRLGFDAIRARFPGRPPLIEIVNARSGDIRIERSAHPEGRRARTLHVLTWDPETGERLSTDVPVWLMKFSSLNAISRLGLAPDKFRLTAEDVARYGPGIVVDYRPTGQAHVMLWVD